MAAKALPSPEVLRQLLRYEPETGKLFWRERGPEWFVTDDPRGPAWAMNCWNAKFAGKQAFQIDRDGYWAGYVLAVPLLAHRVIWAMAFGSWPENDIDHEDLNRKRNVMSNLRAATRSENCCNRGARRDSSSRLKGASPHGKSGKWVARITIRGAAHYLGLFETKEAAHEAYVKASVRLHGDFARTAA